MITVRPRGAKPGAHLRTVVFSGTNSAGTQAAAEYFCSHEDLRRLRDRFREDRETGFPEAYQVVVRARSSATVAMRVEYVTHSKLAAIP